MKVGFEQIGAVVASFEAAAGTQAGALVKLTAHG